jgi:hypothetical protein
VYDQEEDNGQKEKKFDFHSFQYNIFFLYRYHFGKSSIKGIKNHIYLIRRAES